MNYIPPHIRAERNRAEFEKAQSQKITDEQRYAGLQEVFKQLVATTPTNAVFEILKRQHRSLFGKARSDGFTLADYEGRRNLRSSEDKYELSRRVEGWIIPEVFYWSSGTYETEGYRPLDITTEGLLWNGYGNMEVESTGPKKVIGITDGERRAVNIHLGYPEYRDGHPFTNTDRHPLSSESMLDIVKKAIVNFTAQ